MAKVDHATSFYQKMAELQEKLKKSEEERLKLEEKFILMMKTCREEEEKRIRALRERYEKFLEDDKRRRDRNERIIQTLDKIESRAAVLSAKSERLKLLRKHYEAYLIRMYPLWKKQPGIASEQSSPAPYALHLPMDNRKSLPWFGNNSGLFMNNVPLTTTQSSLSPEGDQLWLPPSLPRSAIYVNTKQPILDKTVGRKGSVVEGAVEGALDNYLQHAAELLRVPVEQLEGTSEKCDEEKSVHTEQDTSRDLLNVSLSDDSIQQEKKVEKMILDTVAVKSLGKLMIKEEKHIPIVPDFQAGGDNLLAEQQVVQHLLKIDQHNMVNQRLVSNDDHNMHVENHLIIPENANKNEDTIEILHEALPETNVFADCSVNEAHQESHHVSHENNSQNVVDKNIEDIGFYNDTENNSQDNKHYMNVTKENHVNDDNSQLHDTFNQNIEVPVSDLQSGNTDQPGFLVMQQECSENVENLSYAKEQEANEQLEYSKNMNQNEADLTQDMNNILCEYKENLDYANQNFGATEEKYIHNFENSGVDPNCEGQEYEQQNTSDQEQYVQFLGDNIVQPYEQYDRGDIEQYEQEQYTNNGEHYEKHPEQYCNEQYLDNTAELAESRVNDTEEYKEEQCAVSDENYQEQFINPHQQQDNQYDTGVDQCNEEENASQAQIYEENIDEGTVQEGMELLENVDTQALPQEEIENQSENMNNISTGLTIEDNYSPNEDKIEEGHVLQQVESAEAMNADSKEELLGNQLATISDTEQQETGKTMQEDHVDKTEMGEIQQPKENLTGQAAAVIAETFNASMLEEDSEESSAGFWNPSHRSTIPSVDELPPKVTAVTEDTSESSADSKLDLAVSKSPVQNMHQFRSLLGVPPEPTADSAALSDQDEVEEQLAALVADPVSGGPAASASKFDPTPKEIRATVTDENVNIGKTIEGEISVLKPEKDVKPSKTSAESAKPLARTGLKKPPSLIKVLESDTESLNFDTGATSNVDSDEFDFSTE